jgi:hypothetical protein
MVHGPSRKWVKENLFCSFFVKLLGHRSVIIGHNLKAQSSQSLPVTYWVGWTDGRMDGWTDGRMDGWTDASGLTDGLMASFTPWWKHSLVAFFVV